MAASWPETLPQVVLQQGNRAGIADGRRSSATDTGPGKVWLRTSARADPIDIAMTMTLEQLAIFESFVKEDLAGGSLPFEFPNLRGGGAAWLVRFRSDGMPSWSEVVVDFYEVSMSLEILP